MTKGIAIVTKKTGMGNENLHRYWREVHRLRPRRIKPKFIDAANCAAFLAEETRVIRP